MSKSNTMHVNIRAQIVANAIRSQLKISVFSKYTQHSNWFLPRNQINIHIGKFSLSFFAIRLKKIKIEYSRIAYD